MSPSHQGLAAPLGGYGLRLQGCGCHLCRSPTAVCMGTPAQLKGCPCSLPCREGTDLLRTSRCFHHTRCKTGIAVIRVETEMSLKTVLHPPFNNEKTRRLTWLRADAVMLQASEATQPAAAGYALHRSAVMDVVSELQLLLWPDLEWPHYWFLLSFVVFKEFPFSR